MKNIGSYRHFLESTHWDVVVIDEAHNVAGASVPERNLSYRLARMLARKTHSLLLTTATPHNGQRETFGRLITLLDPSAIPDPELKLYEADDIKSFFLMRFKEDVRQDVGRTLPERHVVPLPQTTGAATEREEQVYAVFADMRQQALDGTSPWKQEPLLQYGLYKQFLSSPESCRITVRKRSQDVKKVDPHSPELGYLKRLETALNGLSLPESARFELFLKQLRDIGWDGTERSPRVIVFTEYRATQNALAQAIADRFKLAYSESFEAQPTQVVAAIHGSFPDVWLMKTIEAFGTGKAPIRLMIATDVASEGINLHHECHHLIHYDLPWSIITLIQRNGRIDRIGQTENPVLRYLRVRPRSGIFAGDETIFSKLIAKVEEINRSTRSGESVLKLYDPEAEERYIAASGVLAGNVNVLDLTVESRAGEANDLETLLSQAAQEEHADYLKFLLGADAPAESPASVTITVPLATSRLRLMTDRQFLVDGYRFLAEQQSDFRPLTENGRLLTLQAPPELQRRLGAPQGSQDVIFGATAIPEEAWPADITFVLSDDPERIELAIKAARQTSGYWSRELLMTDQHPILKWITERLLMLMKRGECPHVFSQGLAKGEICFCFIGQVSSRAGTPLVVDAHAISFHPGGRLQHRPLTEALAAANFEKLINTGRAGSSAAQPLLSSAIDASLDHLRALRQRRESQLVPIVRKEDRRLRAWANARRQLLEDRIQQLGENHPRARRYQQDLREMDGWLQDRRENWLQPHFSGASEPATQLVLVIEGC